MSQKNKRSPLSKLQEKAWSFILGYKNDRGYSPTLRELGEGLGFTTNIRRRAWQVVEGLVEKGWVQKDDHKHRNIVIPGDEKWIS